MKQVTLHIPDKRYAAFIELIKSLDYAKEIRIENKPTRPEILQGIKQAFKEVKLVKSGKLKARPIDDLLNEL